MPHVLHVSQVTEGGLAYCVADYLQAQAELGWRVTLACPGGTLAELTRSFGVAVVWRAAREPGPSVPGEVRRLAAVIRKVDPDVVHLHSSKAGLAGRLALRGRRPTVFMPHAWSFHAVEGAVAQLALAWERASARWAHRIVCVSRSERDEGLALGIRTAYDVIPNVVHVDPLPDADREATFFRQAHDLADEAPVAVCVGRLCRQKGQDVLLAAWPAVRAAVPNARLALVGDGPARGQIEELARSLPGVLLTGDVERSVAHRWINAADAVVLPSRWEGMALVPLEAQALGRPVVVTDVQGAREALVDGAGTIVRPDDPHSLAQALIYFLGDRSSARAAGELGRSASQRRDGTRRNATRLIGIYETLLAERQRVTSPG